MVFAPGSTRRCGRTNAISTSPIPGSSRRYAQTAHLISSHVLKLVIRTGAQAPQDIFYIDDSTKDTQHAPGMGFKLHLYRRGEITALREHLRAEGVAVVA